MKLSRILLSTVAIATVTACGNLSKVTDAGTPEYKDVNGEQVPQLVWPKIDTSGFNHDGSQFGSWPNWSDVRLIERGQNKDQIRQLIGDPHFAEGLYGVEEWDYVFNYRENGIHKVCQYKVLFDKNHNAQSFFWFPNGCNGNSAFSLSGDFLFDFDKDTLTARGKEVVDNVANQLNLSQRRANRVKARLLEDGVVAQISAVGYGKNPQVKACDDVTGKQALRECLKPNRRVEVTASGSVLKLQEGSQSNGGTQGPAPLYQK